ncbi:putative reverse transcriptase domain-containing protein [Tanacetum coccineum]|uniref:Reverse transcriptase domain-containing protein n=1 Tax=Tanacetum coccineum TaxID=301880 RepID=A0ABQ4ZIC0_9ASTR
MPPKKTPMSDAAIEAMIAQGVVDALPDYEVNRGSRNGHDNHNLGIGEGRTSHTARVCTYKDFLNSAAPLSAKLNAIEDTNENDDWQVLSKSKIKKLEIELWNPKVKGTDVVSYTQHFKELALMCERMLPEESDQVEKYVGGLPDMIQGNVMSSKPKMMQEAIKFANDLIDQKIPTFTERQAKKKRKLDNNPRDNQAQQQPFKRQNVARAYTVRPGEKKEYGGTLPLYTKYNYHHTRPCNAKCTNCKRKVVTCFECGIQWHYKKDCLKLKNNNRGNQSRNSKSRRRAYALGGDKANPDSNVVTSMFLLNNRYASILFDTDADRSFMSTAFSSLIDIIPTTLNNYYDVELADGKIIGVNTIIRGCTLKFLNHPFNIDLMPVELGSFDIIIDMDWLSLYHTVIVYDEKIVHVPFGNKTLIIRGDGSNHGNESRLNIISYTKTHKYLLKGCHVFLAHITKKKTEEKSEEKRLENVPIVRDFLKVFPEDLLRVPPTR